MNVYGFNSEDCPSDSLSAFDDSYDPRRTKQNGYITLEEIAFANEWARRYPPQGFDKDDAVAVLRQEYDSLFALVEAFPPRWDYWHERLLGLGRAIEKATQERRFGKAITPNFKESR
jgi:hypothetical protein